ncbi:MAG: metal ABC transporter substrate-binding protein [Planctomycetota bacterium]
MKTLFFLCCVIFFLEGAWAQKLVIVTTTSDLASIAEAVGGDYAEVSSIHTGKQDSHYLTAKPSYMVQIRNADLFIRIGMELEIGWEPLLVKGARNSSIAEGTSGLLDASTAIKPLEIPQGTIDRSMGDVHPYGNPHYWLDPYNARAIAKLMAKRMSELASANQSAYQQKADRFIRKIDTAMFGSKLVDLIDPENLWTLHQENKLESLLREKGVALEGWAGKMAPLNGVKIITYHRSWTYFFSRFHLVSLIELEPKPGISPSTAHLLHVIQLGMEQKPPLVMIEAFYNSKPAELVASKIGAQVLILPNSVHGIEAVSDYVALIDHLVNEITSHIKN